MSDSQQPDQINEESRRDLTFIHGDLCVLDRETGEISPPSAADVVRMIRELKRESDHLYTTRKALEAQLRLMVPEGATKAEIEGTTVQWTESKVYRFEREPHLLRQLWDDPNIPQAKKEAALQIGKRSLTALKALGAYSGAAQQTVEAALDVVDTRTSLKIS